MPRFMTLWQYTAEAQAALANNPEDRSEALRDLLQQAGGELLDYYYCFGEYDGVFHFEAPDDETAQAIIYALLSEGHVAHERTINLQTVEEKMQTLQRAGELSMKPPST